MKISTLSRLLAALTATVFISVSMAATQETNKTTNKPSSTNTKAATAAPTTKPNFDTGTTADNVFYKNDQFWDHGIARMWAGFYVRFTAENLKQYLYGNTVVFANGEKRKIIGSSLNGSGAWDVRVEGDKLDFAKVGSPSKFTVVLAKPPTPAATNTTAAPTTDAATKNNGAAKKAAPTAAPKKTSSK